MHGINRRLQKMKRGEGRSLQIFSSYRCEREIALRIGKVKRDSGQINEVKTKLVNEVSTTKLMKQVLVELIFKE